MSYNFESLQKQVDEAIANPRYYTDFGDIDPNVLHEIQELLNFIRTKGSGRAFREAVAQLFERYILTVSMQGNANLEVSAARGIFSTLKERLEKIDILSNNASKEIKRISDQITNIIATAGNGTVPSELTDIRVGADGETYTTAGKAVREQLKGKADLTVGINLINFAEAEQNYYISYASGGKSPNPEFQISYWNTTAGTRYYSNIISNVHVAFFDASNRFVGGALNQKSFIAPENAVKASVSYAKTYASQITISLAEVDKPAKYQLGIPSESIIDGSIDESKLSSSLLSAIGKQKKIIKVGPNESYTSLLQAITDNRNTINEYRLVSYNSNIYDEYVAMYGSNYFVNYKGYLGTSDANNRGLFLKKGDSLVGDSKSSITFDYDGSNALVNEFFALLNLSVDNIVDNLLLKIGAKKARYIIHDDFAEGNNGTNVISNCTFEGVSFLNTAIGGGMGTASTYIIDTCVFNNAGVLAVTYHNNSQEGALNKYIVKNCYCSEGSHIRGTWYGKSTLMSRMVVTGCKADSITCVSGGSNADIVNLQLLEYCNQTKA